MYCNQQKKYDQRAMLKNVQKALSNVLREKEEEAASKKRKQAVMD